MQIYDRDNLRGVDVNVLLVINNIKTLIYKCSLRALQQQQQMKCDICFC